MTSALKASDTGVPCKPAGLMPFAVFVLGFGIFAMVTSEFQVSGMVPVMSKDLGVSVSQIGYLVSLYAVAMAIGGPLLVMALIRVPPKRALMMLFTLFVCGETLGALAPGYGTLAVARLITGASSGAFFGTALAICVTLVAEERRGWATSIVLGGIMVGTVLGLPMANVIGAHFGWRESFWATAALATLAAVISLAAIPVVAKQSTTSLRGELSTLKNGKLWAAFATSLLIIGATFAAFTYFTPILQNVAGYGETAVAVLLFVYGAATVIGNTVVGRLADRYTIVTLAGGLLMLATFLAVFSLFAQIKTVAAAAMVGIGLVGVTMNPAMVTRVMRTANGRPLVNTVHTSVITLGIMVGASLGGMFIDAGYGLRAPLVVGLALALLGLLTLIPDLMALRRAQVCTGVHEYGCT